MGRESCSFRWHHPYVPNVATGNAKLVIINCFQAAPSKGTAELEACEVQMGKALENDHQIVREEVMFCCCASPGVPLNVLSNLPRAIRLHRC